jgi:hypothetical protein
VSSKNVLTYVRLRSKIESVLYYLTYGSIIHGHRGLGRRMRYKGEIYRNRIDKRIYGSKLYNAFVGVCLVRDLFRQRVHNLIESVDCNISALLLDKMMYCRPAGVSVTGRELDTCKQYLICPFCRYRQLVKVHSWLVARLVQADYLAAVRLRVCADGRGEVPGRYEVGCLRDIGHRLANRRDILARRVVLPAIHWEKLNTRRDDYHRWFLALDVFALVREGVVLPSPARELEAPESAAWQVFPASEAGLVEAIKTYGRYPARLLYSDTPAADFGAMAALQHRVRFVCSDNGVVSDSPIQESYKLMEEIDQ